MRGKERLIYSINKNEEKGANKDNLIKRRKQKKQNHTKIHLI